MNSEGLWEVFKGDSTDMCAGKFLLVSIGGGANGQAAQTVSEDPHRRECKYFQIINLLTLFYQGLRLEGLPVVNALHHSSRLHPHQIGTDTMLQHRPLLQLVPTHHGSLPS
jgi:hypothetical protein